MRTHLDKYGRTLKIGDMIMHEYNYLPDMPPVSMIEDFVCDFIIISCGGCRIGIPQQYATKFGE